jgi:hypothetical protein
MPKPSPYVDLFTAALKEAPHTTAELAELAGCKQHFAFAVLARMHHPTKTLPRRIHVVRWVRAEMPGGIRGQYTPVWAWGNEPDVKKPRAQSAKQIARYCYNRHREERKKRIAERNFKVASVFDLGSLVDPSNHKWKRAA